SVELVFDNADQLPVLHTDEGKVSQILRNFISNAIKYTPQGEVRVSARQRGDRVLFEVRDTGIGIAPQHHDAIFEEFTQLENPLQVRHKGTGLGLPLCRSLAQLLGGKVGVESELGRGSTFFAEIPLVYRGDMSGSQPGGELSATEFHRPVVLLVNHDPDTFARIEPAFRTSEFQLLYAEDPQSAGRWLKGHTPVAVVSEFGPDATVIRAFAGSSSDGDDAPRP